MPLLLLIIIIIIQYSKLNSHKTNKKKKNTKRIALMTPEQLLEENKQFAPKFEEMQKNKFWQQTIPSMKRRSAREINENSLTSEFGQELEVFLLLLYFFLLLYSFFSSSFFFF